MACLTKSAVPSPPALSILFLKRSSHTYISPSGELINFTREIQKKGVTAMNFDVFDKSEIEKYEAEIK